GLGMLFKKAVEWRSLCPEVATRKRATGARLQVHLERRRCCGRVERQRDDEAPGTEWGGMSAEAIVVSIQSSGDVRGQPGVPAGRVALTAQDVDDVRGHDRESASGVPMRFCG